MRALLPAAAAALLALPAHANEFEPQMRAFLDETIRGWIDDPALVAALRDRNAVTSGYDQSRIDSLDAAWRSEVGTSSTPTIDQVVANPTADILRSLVASSGGAVTEIFLMDAVGLNVAASDVTSDMWQGDEAKWTETYGAGPGAAHFSEIAFDESTQSYQGQISVAIADPATGEVLGAMTVGVDAESLM